MSSFNSDELNWLMDILQNYTQVGGLDQAKIYIAVIEKLRAMGGVLPPPLEYSISPDREAPPKPVNPYARSKF